jgi:hypothetical protein
VVSQNRVDENTIVATLSVAGAAVAGDRTVTVINADGGKGYSTTAFAVSAAPTVTGITPGVVNRGGSAQVTITGTNFVSGATVSLSTGVTLTDVQVVDANTITATVNVAATTGAGTARCWSPTRTSARRRAEAASASRNTNGYGRARRAPRAAGPPRSRGGGRPLRFSGHFWAPGRLKLSAQTEEIAGTGMAFPDPISHTWNTGTA